MSCGTVPRLYGDFDTAVDDAAADVDDAAADEVLSGTMVKPGGGGDEVEMTRQQGSEADLRLAGCWLGRAPSRPAVGQRDRSA